MSGRAAAGSRRIVCCKDAQGRLRAALPAYLKRHSYGEYVFDWGWADACRRAGIGYYPKLLSGVPFTPVGGARLLGAGGGSAGLLEATEAGLAEQGLSGWHINFTGRRTMPACAAAKAGWSGWVASSTGSIAEYRDFQDFLDALTSRKRKQLRKEREQVAGQGIDVRLARREPAQRGAVGFRACLLCQYLRGCAASNPI